MTKILSRADVERLLDMKQVVDWMADAFAALSEGSAVVPVRTFLPLPASDDGLLVMPAWRPGADPGSGFYSVKIVSLVHDNPKRGLPFARATVLVMDSGTGVLLAMIEGEQLTAVRTGAGSGLATRLMARSDAKSVVVIGSGRQAATQLEAICAVRKIESCVVMSRSEDSGNRFAGEMSARLGVPVEWIARNHSTASNLLREADIICCATNSSTPVLSLADVSPGTHINGVGSHRADMAEVGEDLVAASRIVLDQRDACLHEAGDIVLPIASGRISAADIAGELGEVVNGSVSGRTSTEEITFFKSVGNGVQDLFVACALYQKAASEGVGVEVDLG